MLSGRVVGVGWAYSFILLELDAGFGGILPIR
jgi:hypothetical protein